MSCRDQLNFYGCSAELKKVFPLRQSDRQALLDLGAGSAPEQYAGYRNPARRLESISEPCQLYITMGCAFVLNLRVVDQSRSSWSSYLNTSSASVMDNYIAPVNETINFVFHYTGASRPPRPTEACSFEFDKIQTKRSINLS